MSGVELECRNKNIHFEDSTSCEKRTELDRSGLIKFHVVCHSAGLSNAAIVCCSFIHGLLYLPGSVLLIIPDHSCFFPVFLVNIYLVYIVRRGLVLAFATYMASLACRMSK